MDFTQLVDAIPLTPGQWFQTESGLHQNWMRDYDPTTGRYLEADPLGLEAGVSLYGYALQNPARFIDQTGKNPIVVVVGAIEGCLASPACTAGVVAMIGGGVATQQAQEQADAGADIGDDCDDKKGCSKATPYQLAQAGIFDPHDFKAEYVTGPVSRWDICACKDGSIILRQVGKCGLSGPSHMTYARWK